MRIIKLPSLFFLVLSIIFFFNNFFLAKPVFSISGGVVISEIQIVGGIADDEFVEFYNPSPTEVVMNGWKLVRVNSGGTMSNLVSNLDGTIPAFGFFLIGNPDYDGAVTPDATYSNTTNGMTNNDTIILYSDNGITPIDIVGMGEAVNFETKATTNPPANGSIRRINLQDTDNNELDFEVPSVSDPQNKSSVSATPTSSPTPTPTPTPTPSESPSPTPEPTESPTPEPLESPTPTPTPTSLPTKTPTPKYHHKEIEEKFERFKKTCKKVFKFISQHSHHYYKFSRWFRR